MEAIVGEYHRGLLCSRCFLTLDKHSDVFELMTVDCSCHVVCPGCLAILHAQRGCAPTFQCPSAGCNNSIFGHRHIYWGSRQQDPIVVDPAITIAPPNDDLDAHRLFRLKRACFQEKHIVLSASWVSQTGNRRNANAVSAIVPYELNCEEYEVPLKEKLLLICRLLYHTFLHPQDDFVDERQRVDVDTVKKFEIFALSNPTYLINVFIGMITGKSLQDLLPQGLHSNPYHKSNYLAAYCGIELMRRSTTTVPGMLQNVIGKHLSIYSVPKAVKETLSNLRIACARETIRLDDIEKVNEWLTKGWEMAGRKFGLIYVMYDNLGFRILGARAGYDQYINVVVNFISATQLQNLGFYLPRGSPEPTISRARVRLELSSDSILPTSRDYCTFGFQIYSFIDALLKICNDIPSVDEARRLLEIDGVFEVDCRLTTTYGAQRRLDILSSNTSQVEVGLNEHFEEEELQDTFGQTTSFNLDDQEIEVDLPIHADLARRNSVRNLCAGALLLRQEVLTAEVSNDDPFTDELPLMEDHGIHQGADGSPKHSFHTLCDDGDVDYQHTYVHGGPFHKHVAVLNGIGRKFSRSHLWYFLDGHRDTDPKKEFFLFPSDPGQTLHELPEMTAPHYIAAMRNLSKIKNGEPISAIDVHDFMLERALKNDHCMVLLMWLHFVEVSNIIRDSESENDPELYRTGATLAMLLFAKTNATKYVRMGMEDFVWWKTSSDADKKIHDSFYFTKKTSSGRTIFFDRFVEWVNKDVRLYLGKYAKPNQEQLMQRTMLLMKERKRRRKEDSFKQSPHNQHHYHKPETAEKTVAISPIFCRQLDQIYMHNYWGTGSVLVGDQADNMVVPQRFTDPTGSHHINTRILFDVSAAEDSLQTVFRECMLAEKLKRKKHSSMDSFLRSTPVLMNDVEEERAQELSRLVSTDKVVLGNVSTVAAMKIRIDLLRQTYGFLHKLVKYKSNAKKDEVAAVLAAHHKEIRRREKNFYEDTKNRLQSSCDKYKDFASECEKKRELEKPFYSFTKESKEPFFRRKFSIHIHDEQQRGLQQQEQQPGIRTPSRHSTAVDPSKTPMLRPLRRLSLG